VGFNNYSTNKLFKIITRKVRHAVHFFEMLEDGDRVVIALSGGVDSLCLLLFLTDSKNNWMQKDIAFFPVHISPGLSEDQKVWQRVSEICRDHNQELLIEERDIINKAFDDDAPFKPCFICSRMRRKALLETAELLGANKIALGHHKDDVIETLFLNMCFSCEISAFMPVQELFKGKFHLIRPMYLTDKALLDAFAQKRSLPSIGKVCPMEGKSHRDILRKHIRELYKVDRNIKKNIFRSLFRPKTDYLPAKYSEILDYI
jgi:tRNA 2-thiocytidine biosynthesis protein TtcA